MTLGMRRRKGAASSDDGVPSVPSSSSRPDRLLAHWTMRRIGLLESRDRAEMRLEAIRIARAFEIAFAS
jgi:hypothetical protein